MARLLSLGKSLALLCVVLLATSSASAQSSPLGHAPARTAYPYPRYYTGLKSYQIYPSDKGYQYTMKIQHYKQAVEEFSAAAASSRPPAWVASVHREAPVSDVVVSVTRPVSQSRVVAVRGPDGQLRSFPLAGGPETIQSRTIVVHPGEKLTIWLDGRACNCPRNEPPPAARLLGSHRKNRRVARAKTGSRIGSE